LIPFLAQTVVWTSYIPPVVKRTIPTFGTPFPVTKEDALFSLVYGRNVEELDRLLKYMREKPSMSVVPAARQMLGITSDPLPTTSLSCGRFPCGSELMDCAFSLAFPPIFLTLLQNGADPNRRLKGGNTYLHVSAHKGNPSFVNLLLRFTLNVNRRNARGQTPLHLACQPFVPCFDKQEIIQSLIARGAFVNIRDREGQVTTRSPLISHGGLTDVGHTLARRRCITQCGRGARHRWRC
jgi:hypothetical protein